MEKSHLVKILKESPSPAFVVDLGDLERNLKTLKSVEDRTGATILLALKGFAMHSTFPLVKKYLKGTCASGLHEARLGREIFGGEVHTFAPGFKRNELEEILRITDHLQFNSFSQWKRWKSLVEASGSRAKIGLRVNPEHSEGTVPIYDPCSPGSRLGIKRNEFEGEDLTGISGLHFHTLCEQNSDALERTLKTFEEKFGEFLPQMEWLNMGGGHHITREDYDLDLLCECITHFQSKYGLKIYLEPGEAIGLNTGILVTEVVDILDRDKPIAILDTSATAHMPDVLEMPYRPQIAGGGDPGEKPYTYTLGGQTCLAGDVIGDWSFDQKLQIGDRITFFDMAHYTMVKTTTFNGIQLPAIATFDPKSEKLSVIKQFGYEDYRDRLS